MSKIDCRNLSSLFIGGFLTEFFFLNKMSIFFQKFESSLEVQRAKRKFSVNLDHNILELYNVSVQIRLTISWVGGDIARRPVSLPEIKLLEQQSQSTQQQISNFSFSVQFCWISLFCTKYFAQDCRLYPYFQKTNGYQTQHPSS